MLEWYVRALIYAPSSPPCRIRHLRSVTPDLFPSTLLYWPMLKIRQRKKHAQTNKVPQGCQIWDGPHNPVMVQLFFLHLQLVQLVKTQLLSTNSPRGWMDLSCEFPRRFPQQTIRYLSISSCCTVRKQIKQRVGAGFKASLWFFQACWRLEISNVQNVRR